MKAFLDEIEKYSYDISILNNILNEIENEKDKLCKKIKYINLAKKRCCKAIKLLEKEKNKPKQMLFNF